MPSKGQVFNAPLSVGAMLQPFIGPPFFGKAGIPLGDEVLMHMHLFMEPWGWRAAGKIISTDFFLTCEKGYGKTTLARAIALRLAALAGPEGPDGRATAMRVRAHDRKLEDGESEWQRTSTKLGLEPTLLANARLNLFDPKMNLTEADMALLGVSTCENVIGRPGQGFENHALQVAIWKMSLAAKADPSASHTKTLAAMLWNLTFDDAQQYFRDSNSEVLEQLKKQKFEGATASETESSTTIESEEIELEEGESVAAAPEEAGPKSSEEILGELELALEVPKNLPERQFQSDAARVAAAFGETAGGQYGHLFDGDNSLYDRLSQDFGLIDWSGVNSERGRSLMATTLELYKLSALNRNDLTIVPHVEVYEEGHEIVGNVVEGRIRVANNKKARGLYTATIDLSQANLDYEEVGEYNSEKRALGNSLLRGMGAWFIGRQPEDPQVLESLQRRLNLTPATLDVLTQLPIGCFGLKIPGKPIVFFRIYLTDLEAELSESDAAAKKMLRRKPVSEDPEFMERVRKAMDAEQRQAMYER